ncbi:ABC transporter permease [Leptolyngbya sp. FACHB-261]|uniref:ABC transporter permease n=1 Tax=Leptolyngbya sp. FACHB-261 TaxID=2692806 RepID=UPI0016853424|nr:ABC transporter permease [Leptolyngbya sp. FACHB-261]MBD2104241.1 ABC transporter permease [Leptolyngbya sp. FACHB-261]
MSVDLVESVGMAVRTLTANKLRSGLTMLGIIIGNASVIAMVSLGQGAQRFVNQQFQGLGTNLLFVVPGTDQGRRLGAVPASSLTLADAEAIKRQVPSVAGVAPQMVDRFRISWASKDTQVNVTGTTPEYTLVRNTAIVQGRSFNDLNLDRNDRVAVLGPATARELFGNRDPIGEKVRIRNLSFRVIGVTEEKGSAFGQNQDEIVYVPVTTMANQLVGRRNSRRSPSLQSISISARDPKSIRAAQFQITNLLRLRHNIRGEDDFTVRSQQDLLQTADNVTGILTIVLAATAGISLLVGGIGIMNIMLVSVTERTQEIGLRKAIGATRADVLTQFTVEAVILATAGGMIGIVLGVGGTLLVGTFTPLDAIISPAAIVLAVSVSGAIGLGFGVFPARSAARLDPIVALRSQ